MWSFSDAIVLKDCFSLYLILKNKGDRSKPTWVKSKLNDDVLFLKKVFLVSYGELEEKTWRIK